MTVSRASSSGATSRKRSNNSVRDSRVLSRFHGQVNSGRCSLIPHIGSALHSAKRSLRLAPTQLRPDRLTFDCLVERSDALLVGELFRVAGTDDAQA